MTGIIKSLGIKLPGAEETLTSQELPSETSRTEVVAAGVSTFVVAYAIHKITAPGRIAITLVSAPFIVRNLRKRGILKPPKIS